jgi:two-component system, cell cycle sensor histidine kinase and response regulator CckA
MPEPSGKKKLAPYAAEDHRVSEPASTFLPDYSVAIVESVREPLVLLDAGLRVLVANAAFYRSFGGTPDLVRRRSLFDLAEGRWDAPELHSVLQALQEANVAFENHEVRVTMDGRVHIYRLNARKLEPSESDGSIILLAFEDVTESLRVEERLRDLARMEAIGQLAGGVAHEINNQMTVLIGFMSFVTRNLPPDDPERMDLAHAERAAEHVVYITRQLLNFSRKQMIRREAVDAWAVLLGMQRLLGRLLGSDIQVNIVRRGETGAVNVDAGQFGEVFVNLALYARYAMGRTGTFEIALSAIHVDEHSVSAFPDQPPGRYVRFEVRDTGTGMDEGTRRRVFEPFFTTKPIGEGTGLGLASVFGSVSQNGGFIRVESGPAQGTTFIIELPEVTAARTAGGHPGVAVHDLPRGDETVIVADDEEGVRRWVSRVLRHCGYTVLEARDGVEALRLWAGNTATVRLVVTDLVMANADGREIGERLAAQAPHLPVIYMSAYTVDEIMRRQLLAPSGAFLQKPFSAEQLAQRVRAALDGTPLRA